MNKNWYKNAIIYSLDIETYLDKNGDGVGDILGLKNCLHYLSGIGINCIWLLPIFKSPNLDNGYDVSDYYTIDERLGNLGIFVEFIDAAEELGIKVIIDLTINHTSDQHPWFQEARKNPNSKYRNYYIWSEEEPEPTDGETVFGEHQGNKNWGYDEEAKAYYYHTFYPHQADLNLTNPEVQEEIRRIMHFWLKLGVAGFRLDAVTHILEKKGDVEFKDDPHQFLRDMRKFVVGQRQDALLLAEADLSPDDYKNYFGNGDQMHMLFNFYLNNYIFLALAREDAGPVIHGMERVNIKPAHGQMANFLRNHDQLDLDQLTDEEREEVFRAFAPDENMRVFGGIRRRLAPMLNNDRKKMELAYSLLLSLPGTPVIRYGQEIGMGDDLSLRRRRSVRTPMQWSAEKNGGFSEADKEQLVTPVISEGEYSYKKVNVNDQHRNPSSLLNWLERAINNRKECPEFGSGEWEIIKTDNSQLLMHSCKWKNHFSVAIHNFGPKEVTFKLNLPEDEAKNLIEIFSDRNYEEFDPKKKEFSISGYGYRWLSRNRLKF